MNNEINNNDIEIKKLIRLLLSNINTNSNDAISIESYNELFVKLYKFILNDIEIRQSTTINKPIQDVFNRILTNLKLLCKFYDNNSDNDSENIIILKLLNIFELYNEYININIKKKDTLNLIKDEQDKNKINKYNEDYGDLNKKYVDIIKNIKNIENNIENNKNYLELTVDYINLDYDQNPNRLDYTNNELYDTILKSKNGSTASNDNENNVADNVIDNVADNVVDNENQLTDKEIIEGIIEGIITEKTPSDKEIIEGIIDALLETKDTSDEDYNNIDDAGIIKRLRNSINKSFSIIGFLKKSLPSGIKLPSLPSSGMRLPRFNIAMNLGALFAAGYEEKESVIQKIKNLLPDKVQLSQNILNIIDIIYNSRKTSNVLINKLTKQIEEIRKKMKSDRDIESGLVVGAIKTFNNDGGDGIVRELIETNSIKGGVDEEKEAEKIKTDYDLISRLKRGEPETIITTNRIVDEFGEEDDNDTTKHIADVIVYKNENDPEFVLKGIYFNPRRNEIVDNDNDDSSMI